MLNVDFTDYKIIIAWLLIVLVMMVVDMATGFAQAFINHSLKSHKMSNGIIKKACIVLVLVSLVPLTFVLPDTVTIPLLITLFLSETVNEFVSISENLRKMGVDTKYLQRVYKRLQDVNESEEKQNG